MRMHLSKEYYINVLSFCTNMAAKNVAHIVSVPSFGIENIKWTAAIQVYLTKEIVVLSVVRYVIVNLFM